MPYIGLRETLGQRVVIAWDGGREAGRAIADALPILTQAAEVEVVVIMNGAKEDSLDHEPGADISTYLARHGCWMTLQRLAAAGLSVEERLLSHLADCGGISW